MSVYLHLCVCTYVRTYILPSTLSLPPHSPSLLLTLPLSSPTPPPSVGWPVAPEHHQQKEETLVNGDHGSLCLFDVREKDGSPDELEHIQRSVASYIEMTHETTATVDIPGCVNTIVYYTVDVTQYWTAPPVLLCLYCMYSNVLY